MTTVTIREEVDIIPTNVYNQKLVVAGYLIDDCPAVAVRDSSIIWLVVVVVFILILIGLIAWYCGSNYNCTGNTTNTCDDNYSQVVVFTHQLSVPVVAFECKSIYCPQYQGYLALDTWGRVYLRGSNATTWTYLNQILTTKVGSLGYVKSAIGYTTSLSTQGGCGSTWLYDGYTLYALGTYNSVCNSLPYLKQHLTCRVGDNKEYIYALSFKSAFGAYAQLVETSLAYLGKPNPDVGITLVVT